MNSYPYNSTAINQPHFNPYNQRAQSAINPTLLQSSQQSHLDNNASSTASQQNLINANMNAIGTVNPAAMMNGSMNSTSNIHQMSGMQQSSDPSMMQQYQQLQANTMSPQDFQIAQQKMYAQRQAQQHFMGSNPAMNMGQYSSQHQQQQPLQQQQQQQQQQQSPSTYYSPSSMGPPQQIPGRPQTALSMQMPTPQLMQPNIPRPPTAASHSRPGTAGSIPSQSMAGSSGLYSVTSQQQQAQAQGGNNRPPSRPQTAGSSHSASGTGGYQTQQQSQTSPVGGQFNVGMNGFSQQQQQNNYTQMPQSQNQMRQSSPTVGSMNMNMNGGSMQLNQQQRMHNQAQVQQQPPMNMNLTGSPYLGSQRKSIQDGNVIAAIVGQQQQQMAMSSPQISQTGRMAASASGANSGQMFNTNTNQPGQIGQHNLGMGMNSGMSVGMGGMRPAGGQMDGNTGMGIGSTGLGAAGMMGTQQNISRQMSAGPGDLNRQQQQQQHLDQNNVPGQSDLGQQQRPGMPVGYQPMGPVTGSGTIIDGASSTPTLAQARLSQMQQQQQQQQQQRVQSRGSHPGMTGGMQGGVSMSPTSYGPVGGIGVGISTMGNPSQLIGSPVSAGGLHTQPGQHSLQQPQHTSNSLAMSMQPNMNAGASNVGIPGGVQINAAANMGALSPMQIQQLQERKLLQQQQSQLQQNQLQQQQHIQQIRPGTPTTMGPRSAGPSSSGGLLAPPNVPPGPIGVSGGSSNVPAPGAYLAGPSSSPGGVVQQNHQQQQPQRPPAMVRPPSANVSLGDAITRITQVPLVDSMKLIPSLEAREIEEMKMWIKNDKEYEAVYRAMQKRMREEIVTVGKVRKWWERDDHTEMGVNGMRRKEPFKIVYPRTSPSRDGQQLRDGRRKIGKRDGLRFPARVKTEDAKRADQLVPIRLEFDVEHYRYRDTFVWNLNDPVVTPEHFAQTVVEDYGLSANFHSIITKSIQEQLSDYRAHSSLFADVDDTRLQNAEAEISPPRSGLLEGEDLEWWEKWRKRLRSKRGGVKSSLLDSALDPDPAAVVGHSKKKRKLMVDDKVKPSSTNLISSNDDVFLDTGFLEEDNLHEEMRILIKLDITAGSVKLDDQFEWDLENSDTTPEQFAEIYSNDLGLVGEFKTAIAHSIREQVHTYQKSLFLVGHPSDGSAVQDEDLKSSFLSPVLSVARMPDQTTAYTPTLNYLSDGELDRIDKEREKELNKRRKRNTRGRRGLMLPDREPIKTHRTPAIGFSPIDSSLLAIAAAAAAPTSRRAAAAAATVNIAQMVASENGTAIVSTTTVPVIPQTSLLITSKLPKPRGSFKPPSYPSSVLKARARVAAPTPSTSADASNFEPPLEGDLPLPSITVPSTPDLRASKIMSARRQRELEKEAKEKEFADGQHANIIDGIWHCSNCGCPDSIAIGRRKGPLGDKSQCGACGKFWHRHRRPRPVEYHTDAEYHMSLKLEAERGKIPAKKRGNRVTNTETREPTPTRTSVPPTSTEIDQISLLKPDIPSDSKSPRRSRAVSTEPLDRPISRASSTTSSASERPLAQAVMQVNGVNHKPVSSKNGSRSDEIPAPISDPQPQSESTPPQTTTELPENLSASNSENDITAPTSTVVSEALPPPSAPAVVSTLPTPPTRPKWLDDAISEILTRYPDDRIDVIMRRVSPDAPPDWRVKCLDCPGKLYMHGPGETLNGYEVHLRNRQHRARVHARVHGS